MNSCILLFFKSVENVFFKTSLRYPFFSHLFHTAPSSSFQSFQIFFGGDDLNFQIKWNYFISVFHTSTDEARGWACALKPVNVDTDHKISIVAGMLEMMLRKLLQPDLSSAKSGISLAPLVLISLDLIQLGFIDSPQNELTAAKSTLLCKVTFFSSFFLN